MTLPFRAISPCSNFPLPSSHHPRVARQVLPLCSLLHAVIRPTSPTAHESSHRPVRECMSLSASGSWHPFRASSDYREHRPGVRYRAAASPSGWPAALPGRDPTQTLQPPCSRSVPQLLSASSRTTPVGPAGELHSSQSPFFATTSRIVSAPHDRRNQKQKVTGREPQMLANRSRRPMDWTCLFLSVAANNNGVTHNTGE